MWPELIVVGLVIFVGLGLYAKGRRDVTRETALQAAERIARDEVARGKKEEEIDQDVDLAGRARRTGLVRKPGD